MVTWEQESSSQQRMSILKTKESLKIGLNKMNPTKTLLRVGENQKCEQKIFIKGKCFFHQPPTPSHGDWTSQPPIFLFLETKKETVLVKEANHISFELFFEYKFPPQYNNSHEKRSLTHRYLLPILIADDVLIYQKPSLHAKLDGWKEGMNEFEGNVNNQVMNRIGI